MGPKDRAHASVVVMCYAKVKAGVAYCTVSYEHIMWIVMAAGALFDLFSVRGPWNSGGC